MKVQRTKQCEKCPWKKSTDPNDIPGGYSPEKHARLNVCQAPGTSGIGRPQNWMACHESSPRKPYACVGWLVNQLGPGNNFGLRLRAMLGELGDVDVLQVDGDQYDTVDEMVATAPNG